MSKLFKSLFDFYINSSIHVALAVCGLCLVTVLKEGFPIDGLFFGFVFFASVTGYNFVKYAGIAKLHHRSLTDSLKSIQIFSFFCFLALCYFIFYLPKEVLLMVGILGLLTLLYALPIFTKERSFRTIKGLKIYIIAMVWAGVAGILPILYFEETLTFKVLINSIQYALFILAIILPFEIRDLKYDSAILGTLPQKIGVKKTKLVGVIFLSAMLMVGFLKLDVSLEHSIASMAIAFIASLFIIFSKENQTPYYSSFWVESLPLIWAGIVFGLRLLF